MRSIPIPPRVSEALRARNPYGVVWESSAAHKVFRDLSGPAQEIAERLVAALGDFPPPIRDFDIIEIRESLGAAGFKVTVATGTHIRVTVVAIYREAQKVVSIRDFQMSPRHPEKLRRARPEKGDKP